MLHFALRTPLAGAVENPMKRRQFIKQSALLAGTTAALAGCQTKVCEEQVGESGEPARNWKLVTTWPKNFPGLGTGANHLADLINDMTGGRIKVKVYGAGELVPAFEVFDAVSRGTAEMGHGAAYYWKGKVAPGQFFGAVPFGMNVREMNAWLYHGGGLDLWQKLYEPFDLIPFPAGSTGVQMGGWFNKEINSVADLQGLKMRIPGLGGEVLRMAGGTPVNLPGAELFTALQTGAIDATEWVGPSNDLAFGLFKAAKYYYYPGWHEPNATLECVVSGPAWRALPDDLKAIVATACKAASLDMSSDFAAKNPAALESLIDEHKVELRRFPDDVLRSLKGYSEQVVSQLAESDQSAARIYESYQAFAQQAEAWTRISERAYLEARSVG